MYPAGDTLGSMVTRHDPDDIETYREGLREREREERKLVRGRYDRAWEIARELASVLRSRYGATRVVLFGSLLSEPMFTMLSDIDVAAWGIAADESMRAVGEAMDLGGEIGVQLVFPDSCSSTLLAVIEKEGVEI
jgi:predicted nucleotidyltransferase